MAIRDCTWAGVSVKKLVKGDTILSAVEITGNFISCFIKIEIAKFSGNNKGNLVTTLPEPARR